MLEYPDQLSIKGLNNGDLLKIQKDTRLIDFLDKLEPAQCDNSLVIEAIVNDSEVSLLHNLRDGDRIKLIAISEREQPN